MPRWLTITLAALPIAVGGLFLFTVAMGFLWFAVGTSANASHEKRVTEARGFGRTHPVEGCIAEALRRADRCDAKDILCFSRAKDFLAYSAPQAAGWKELCATLPRGTEAKDGWVAAQCATRGRSDDRCLYVTTGILVGCPSQW